MQRRSAETADAMSPRKNLPKEGEETFLPKTCECLGTMRPIEQQEFLQLNLYRSPLALADVTTGSNVSCN